ncbi:hypothetical protein AURDEDRAFT_158033, partial [Auricularia subglabra TFB-10046 SS5]
MLNGSFSNRFSQLVAYGGDDSDNEPTPGAIDPPAVIAPGPPDALTAQEHDADDGQVDASSPTQAAGAEVAQLNRTARATTAYTAPVSPMRGPVTRKAKDAFSPGHHARSEEEVSARNSRIRGITAEHGIEPIKLPTRPGATAGSHEYTSASQLLRNLPEDDAAAQLAQMRAGGAGRTFLPDTAPTARRLPPPLGMPPLRRTESVFYVSSRASTADPVVKVEPVDVNLRELSLAPEIRLPAGRYDQQEPPARPRSADSIDAAFPPTASSNNYTHRQPSRSRAGSADKQPVHAELDGMDVDLTSDLRQGRLQPIDDDDEELEYVDYDPATTAHSTLVRPSAQPALKGADAPKEQGKEDVDEFEGDLAFHPLVLGRTVRFVCNNSDEPLDGMVENAHTAGLSPKQAHEWRDIENIIYVVCDNLDGEDPLLMHPVAARKKLARQYQGLFAASRPDIKLKFALAISDPSSKTKVRRNTFAMYDIDDEIYTFLARFTRAVVGTAGVTQFPRTMRASDYMGTFINIDLETDEVIVCLRDILSADGRITAVYNKQHSDDPLAAAMNRNAFLSSVNAIQVPRTASGEQVNDYKIFCKAPTG